MLDLAVLGLLKEGDLHGYELNKRLKALVGGYATSFGALYPALARLERDGWVSAVSGVPAAATSAPPPEEEDTSGRGRRTRRNPRRKGRTRKVYSITKSGERHLMELLQDDVSNERRFRLQLAFCRFLSPEDRLELLELRRAHLVGVLGAERRRDSDGSANDPYVRSLFQRDKERIQHDLAWLDQLIARERGGQPTDFVQGGQQP